MGANFGVILIVAAVALNIVAWMVKRRRTSSVLFRIDPDELMLVKRAAEGDESAARELSDRAEAESVALRRHAETDRRAALEYRKELRQKLRALEPLTAQLASLDVSEAKRHEAQERIRVQQAEAQRELEWVEDRLGVLPK